LVPTTAVNSAEPPGNLAAAHLLPGFDEYLLGYADRGLALGTDDAGRIVPGNNGVFLPTMLRSGRVVGTWRKSGTGPGSGEVEFSPFGELSATGLRSVRTAARKRRDYLGR
ncbi:MAG: winged helix DNA-binding domain-containing protein, partial [Renibacterium salmoninarum]|nr:winged helix DNA-binding domain-containing protein [Renibacterium salmoninarum]